MDDQHTYVTIDGNEAAAHVAFRVNEVCAIYPITPSSPMAELADTWAAKGMKNIFGTTPEIIEMQSEAGAAGAVHGSLQAGSLTTTFTASQGLMLMIPNMYKIAGELTPAVFHVAARSLAAQALSIFGDHSDVMATRSTGFAILASASVQEAHDMALIAQVATLQSRIPFLHFFDGFRTSHEVSKIALIPNPVIREMIKDEWVIDHRKRALNPDNPFIRGTAQNPDVYFQARETVNTFYDKTPGIVEAALEDFAELTGRKYGLFEYYGHPEAEKVIVIMASGSETAIQAVELLAAQGEKVGVIKVRLYRPFSGKHFIEMLPSTVKSVVVMDRTKEPGSTGEPLYLDVIAIFNEAITEGTWAAMPRVTGGRYGLSSKEFTPAMVKGILDEQKKDSPKNHFTVGIIDDVTHTSIDYDPMFVIHPEGETRAVFFGLGADGTVGANKNSIKIIGEGDVYAQGYFVYDSKKSGAQTVSHLRFGPQPIRSPYLIDTATFVACHQFGFMAKTDVLKYAEHGAIFLLNSPYGPGEVWDKLPLQVQQQIQLKKLQFFVIDASGVAKDTGMGQRINTIMQACFFGLSGVLPRETAIASIKKAIEKSYFFKGKAIIQQNFQAVDQALAHVHEVRIPDRVSATNGMRNWAPDGAPEFVKKVTARIMAGQGDELPVSAFPVDGTFPSGTTKWEKRDIATEVPVWEPDICIQCGNCAFVCPHSVIRAKFYHENHLEAAPERFQSADISAKGFPETKYTLQVYGEDCTGCNLCEEACPAFSLTESGKKAIHLVPKTRELIEENKQQIAFFETLPLNDRRHVDFGSVRGTQYLEPLFEFSGACAGCGETPYLRLLSQLFGDRLIVANATGCSSIYGGNLPTTPWTQNKDGRGPAWSNSLFEDNAEFGLGMRVSADKHLGIAFELLESFIPDLGKEFIHQLTTASQATESQIMAQRERVGALKTFLLSQDRPEARHLMSVADHLVRRSIWLVGGDGWAYDIGSSGLDHALASGKNINVLVLDTEVYSNTGGQMSKATPTAAVAKFASAGKRVGKKDLALQAISYGNVYVAQIAMGANPQQTLLAMREAEAYPGPSLILAYSHCIAHGIDMTKGMNQQDLAVASGYWPLIRYNPELVKADYNPFVLDSPRPKIPLKEYAYNELRYRMLAQTNPDEAAQLMQLAQDLVNQRWKTYEEMAIKKASDFQAVI